MKAASFADVFVSEPEDLLIKLTNLLLIKNDFELTTSAMKLILSLLERYEKINNALPVGALRQSSLIAMIAEYLPVGVNSDRQQIEFARHSLSIMI
jgi:hypothetical protein